MFSFARNKRFSELSFFLQAVIILRYVSFCLASNFALIRYYYFLMKIMKSLTWNWDISKACIAISFETPLAAQIRVPSILGPYLQTVKSRNMQQSSQYSVGAKNSDSFYKKLKCKIPLSTPLRHIGGVAVWFHSFFTSGVGGWVNFTPRPLFPPGKETRIHIEQGAGSEHFAEEENLFHFIGVC
jgi:hypothetical protein